MAWADSDPTDGGCGHRFGLACACGFCLCDHLMVIHIKINVVVYLAGDRYRHRVGDDGLVLMVLYGRLLVATHAAAMTFMPRTSSSSSTANSGRLDDGTGRGGGRQAVQGGGEDAERARLRLRSGGCGRRGRGRGRRSWRIGSGRDLLRVLLATAATNSRPSFRHAAMALRFGVASILIDVGEASQCDEMQ